MAFFVAWSDLVINGFTIIHDLFVYVGIMFPFALLVGVLHYQSRYAYLLVAAIFLLCALMNLTSLPFLFGEAIREYNGEALDCSCCRICELRGSLLTTSISFLAIGLLHNKVMVEKYNWSLMLFCQALILALLINVLLINF